VAGERGNQFRDASQRLSDPTATSPTFTRDESHDSRRNRCQAIPNPKRTTPPVNERREDLSQAEAADGVISPSLCGHSEGF
jgi:hypothetical protein